MVRFINALLVFLLMLAAAAVYDMKYEAELAEENVRRLERTIAQEKEAISMLKAEWSVLSQPGRLQELIERHHEILRLQPLTSAQIGTLVDIPQKPQIVDPEVDGPADGILPAEPAQRQAHAPDALPPTNEAVR